MFNLSSNFQGKPKNNEKRKEWRLFHAKDFQSLMSPCFTFCRILGIFPYKINASTFEISIPHYILWSVIICVCGIYILITMPFNFSLLIENTDIKILPWLFVRCCTYVFGGFTVIVTFILSGPRMRLLQLILKVSSRLPVESYQKLSRLIHTKDIIGFLYLGGIMLISNAIILQIDVMCRTYIILVIFQMDMLYMNCVFILKYCFKRISDNLMYMREFMTNDNGSRSIYYEQRNPFLIMELKALKKEHLTISEIVQMLNTVFSWQLLATVVMTFFEITLQLYYYIQNWQNISSFSTLTLILYHIYVFLQVTYNIIKIALIAWTCETSKNQALQIITSIHDVLNSITNEQIKNELQLFSLQTLHCKNIFFAKGLTIDAKLLTVIASNITMYLLILIQFLNISYPRWRDSN